MSPVFFRFADTRDKQVWAAIISGQNLKVLCPKAIQRDVYVAGSGLYI